ncbi:AI-2E family transporter, partial [Clostridium perfringens]|uniref:AI-2E family transporter n=1 Tax=Clostridium perfringens TaxID=1502 RepID=UPI002AC4310B
LCFVGMTSLSMPYALLISVLIAVTALIPIFGAFIGAIPSVFLILLINPIQAFWFIIFILCLQQFEGNVIYPKVVGNSVGLSALWVMLAMIVGGSTLGLLGMLIGIPTFSVVYQLIKDYTNKRLQNKDIKI